MAAADRFPDDVLELQHYFEEPEPGQKVRAVPGAGLKVPIWLLGSSLFSAQMAARLGLPFAFASHFAPTEMMDALRLYRGTFRPSKAVGEAVPDAGDQRDLRRRRMEKRGGSLHFGRSSRLQICVAGRRDRLVPPPIDDIDDVLVAAGEGDG